MECLFALLDDIDHTMSARVDEYSTIVHNRIAIVRSAVFRRHFVIGYALGGKLSALSTDIGKIQATMKVGVWLVGGLGTLATVAKALHWI